MEMPTFLYNGFIAAYNLLTILALGILSWSNAMDPEKLKESVGRAGYSVKEIRDFLRSHGVTQSKILAQSKEKLVELALKSLAAQQTTAPPAKKKKAKKSRQAATEEPPAVSAAAPAAHQSPARVAVVTQTRQSPSRNAIAPQAHQLPNEATTPIPGTDHIGNICRRIKNEHDLRYTISRGDIGTLLVGISLRDDFDVINREFEDIRRGVLEHMRLMNAAVSRAPPTTAPQPRQLPSRAIVTSPVRSQRNLTEIPDPVSIRFSTQDRSIRVNYAKLVAGKYTIEELAKIAKLMGIRRTIRGLPHFKQVIMDELLKQPEKVLVDDPTHPAIAINSHLVPVVMHSGERRFSFMGSDGATILVSAVKLEQNCGVCGEAYASPAVPTNGVVVAFECGHSLCYACFRHCGRTCPFCRKPIDDTKCAIALATEAEIPT